MPMHMPRIGGRRRTDDTPIGAILKVFRRYLHLPDPQCLQTLMGAVAGNMIAGHPVFLMLVGGSSSGKTVLLESLLDLEQVYEIDSPSGEGAFLSGTKDKERSKGASGGSLREVGLHGAFVMQDFTTILSRHPNLQEEILSVLRQCANGRWSRPVGTDGGKSIGWQGRLGFFGGCTRTAIEKRQSQVASMGERWVYFRMDEDEAVARAKAQTAMRRPRDGRDSDWKQVLRDTVVAVFDSLELGFRGPDEGPDRMPRALSDLEVEKVVRLGEVASRCRSVVERDPYSHEVVTPPEIENPGRISESLMQMLLGMELIGVEEEERWGVLRKLAEDSIPMLRRMIIEEVRTRSRVRSGTGPQGQVTVSDLVNRTKCGVQAVRRAVDDLQKLDVLDTVGVLDLGRVNGNGHANGNGAAEDSAGGGGGIGGAGGAGSKTIVRLTGRAKRDMDRGWPL